MSMTGLLVHVKAVVGSRVMLRVQSIANTSGSFAFLCVSVHASSLRSFQHLSVPSHLTSRTSHHALTPRTAHAVTRTAHYPSHLAPLTPHTLRPLEALKDEAVRMYLHLGEGTCHLPLVRQSISFRVNYMGGMAHSCYHL